MQIKSNRSTRKQCLCVALTYLSHVEDNSLPAVGCWSCCKPLHQPNFKVWASVT